MIRFIITGYARTGSSLLMRMLMSHPQVHCYGELFNYGLREKFIKDVTNPVLHLEEIFAKDEGGTHQGFKIFSTHASKPPFNQIWDYIETGFRVVMLTRNNLLNRYLSQKLVQEHSWAWADVEFAKPVQIKRKELIRDVSKYRRAEDWLRERFSACPFYEMAYEDLVKPDSYGKILSFLNLPWRKPEFQMQKQRTKSQEIMITNYWSLKESLSDTDLVQYFDEPEVKIF